MRAPAFGEIVSLLRKYAALILVLILVCITYAQIAGHAFISYDDTEYITENPFVTKGLTWASISWAFTSFDISYWHPLTWISHMIDYEIYGNNPAGHHMTSLMIHLANTLMVFSLLYYPTRRYWQSVFVAAVFALHPLHVESVVWAAERKDVLSSFFLLLTVLSYSASVIRKSRTFYVLAIISYMCGLMSKPMVVSLPLVLLVWDYWPLNRYRDQDVRKSQVLWEKVPFVLLAAATAIVTYYAQAQVGTLMSSAMAPLSLRAVNALSSYLNYIMKMFWPQDLAVIYPYPRDIPLLRGVVSGLVLLGISVVAYHNRDKRPYLIAGWAWYVITLLPVIGIVQSGLQSMADRYTYTTQIGLYVMIAWGMTDLVGTVRIARVIVTVAGVAVIIALTIVTSVQAAYWKDSITLFDHAAHAIQNNNIAYRILGNNYAKKGDVTAAIAALTEALKIQPDDAIAHVDLGVALVEQKRYYDAMYHYRQAIGIRPGFANAYYNLGVVLAYENRFAEALDNYAQALRFDPAQKGAHASTGAVLARLGRLDEAVAELRAELRIDPGNEAVRNFLRQVEEKQRAAK